MEIEDEDIEEIVLEIPTRPHASSLQTNSPTPNQSLDVQLNSTESIKEETSVTGITKYILLPQSIIFL
jgi:hypothetical protein